MRCKNHPNRQAEQFCTNCGIPLCGECAEKGASGDYFCFQCTMMQTVSGVGTTLKDKKQKATEKKLNTKKAWGPFQYFIIVSSVLIVVMWGVILFGGQKAPGSQVDFANQPRILLFMVDGAIKRYAHYEDNKYPNKLTDLIPKYLNLNEEDRRHLDRLSYQKHLTDGYRLFLTHPKPGDMNIIISAKGITSASSPKEEPK